MTRPPRETQPPLPALAITLALTDHECEVLHRPIEPGEWGGHQRFASELQNRLGDSSTLDVTDFELQRAFRYGYGYGSGTWEQYSRAVVAAAVRAGWQPPMADEGDDVLRAAIERYLSMTRGF